MSDTSTSRVFRADPGSVDQHEVHHRAAFTACHSSESTVLVTVTGEVDAANGRALAGYVERQIVSCRRLVLDLRLIDFFGTGGFAALHNINVTCSRRGVTWQMKAGRQVRRLLAVCDPDGVLPIESPQSVLDEVDTATAS
jgi:anti-anti-sigma factor